MKTNVITFVLIATILTAFSGASLNTLSAALGFLFTAFLLAVGAYMVYVESIDGIKVLKTLAFVVMLVDISCVIVIYCLHASKIDQCNKLTSWRSASTSDQLAAEATCREFTIQITLDTVVLCAGAFFNAVTIGVTNLYLLRLTGKESVFFKISTEQATPLQTNEVVETPVQKSDVEKQ
ncbi:hypothetical protein EDD86DRAFT_219660 [Gorgonomyces haynaldii]|nr:hypothetical protein EDD86DRAFT_219660 [Gorgonomyces haynaldii]